MFKFVMEREKKLKKINGDLKAQKQNVVSLELIIREQNVVSLEPTIGEKNVVSSKPRVDELNNQCGLELAIVTICNSNDRKMVGSIVLKFTYIRVNAEKRLYKRF
jgi:hypothetical protein